MKAGERLAIILPAAAVMAAISGLLSYWSIPLPLHLDSAWPGAIRRLVYGILLPDLTLGHGYGFWHPGYVFGLVLAVLLHLGGRVSIGRALLALPVSVIAWAAAFWLAIGLVNTFTPAPNIVDASKAPLADYCIPRDAHGIRIFDRSELDAARRATCEEIDRYRQQMDPLLTRLSWLVTTVAGLSAGLAGALICVIGLGLISRRLRRLDTVLLVTLTGAAAGLLFVPYQHVWRGDSEPLKALLYIVWQAAVAMAIAWQLGPAVSRGATD
jgi:hypothetical protein